MDNPVKVEMSVTIRDLNEKTPIEIIRRIKDELHRIYVLGITKFPSVKITLDEIVINYRIEGKEKR